MKNVILILIDGMRPDAMMNCGSPYAEELLKQATYTLEGKTVYPSDTLPCHMSLFTSVSPIQHQTTSNTYCPPVNTVNGLIEELDHARKKAAMFYNWGELRDIARPGYFNFSLFMRDEDDANITDYAIDYISKKAPHFTFLYLGNVDMFGHHNGWMSEEYLASVKKALDCTKRVLDAFGDEYTYIITADHGGHDTDHGSMDPEDINIPILFIGDSFEKNKQTEASIIDIAPTIADLMEVEKPHRWDGKSIIG